MDVSYNKVSASRTDVKEYALDNGSPENDYVSSVGGTLASSSSDDKVSEPFFDFFDTFPRETGFSLQLLASSGIPRVRSAYLPTRSTLSTRPMRLPIVMRS